MRSSGLVLWWWLSCPQYSSTLIGRNFCSLTKPKSVSRFTQCTGYMCRVLAAIGRMLHDELVKKTAKEASENHLFFSITNIISEYFPYPAVPWIWTSFKEHKWKSERSTEVMSAPFLGPYALEVGYFFCNPYPTGCTASLCWIHGLFCVTLKVRYTLHLGFTCWV